MLTFYERYVKLCSVKGISLSAAAEKIGLSRTSPHGWKNGKYPSDVNMQKIADYFGVSVEYLRGETDQKKKPLVNEDEELTEYLEELKNRDEMRMLFSVTKDCTKEEVQQAVRIIEALRKNGD